MIQRVAVMAAVAAALLAAPAAAADMVSKVPIYGGEVNNLSICRTDPSVLYAGNGHGGLWVSRDAGETWGSTAFYLTANSGSDCFAVHAAQPGVIVARAAENNMLYRSADYGQTWSETGAGQFYAVSNIRKILASPTEANVFYILSNSADGEVHKSDDGGLTWTKTGFTTGGKTAVDMAINDSGTLFVTAVNTTPTQFIDEEDQAAGSGWVFRSMNGGTSWTTASTFSTSTPWNIAADSSTVAVMAYGVNQGMYLSIDNAQNFTRKSDVTAGMGTAVAVSPSNGGVFCFDYDRFLKVSSYTGTWNDFADISTTLLDGIHNVWASTLLIDPADNDTMYMSDWYQYGLLKSTDGGVTWRVNNAGLDGLLVYEGCKAPDGTLYVLGRASIYRSANGTSWTEVFNSSAQFDAGAITAPTPTLVVASGSQKVWRSADAGQTWDEVLAVSQHYQPARNIVFRRDDPTIGYIGFYNTDASAATSEYYIYKTTDSGATWTPLNVQTKSVFSMALDPENPAVLYIGVGESRPWDDRSVAFGGLYRITDNGGPLTPELVGLANTIPYRIAFSTVNPSAVFAACVDDLSMTAGPLYVSRDKGAGWQRLSSFKNENDIFTSGGGVMDVEYSYPAFYFGHSNGVYVSVNDGVSAEKIVERNTIGGVNCLIVGSMYAGASNGFYKVLWRMTPLTTEISKPKAYGYPNPFNAKTGSISLKYMIPQGKLAETLRVSVYNTAGELVREFPEQTSLPGGFAYYIDWDGRNQSGALCAEGVYFVVFKSNIETARTNVVLVK